MGNGERVITYRKRGFLSKLLNGTTDHAVAATATATDIAATAIATAGTIATATSTTTATVSTGSIMTITLHTITDTMDTLTVYH